MNTSLRNACFALGIAAAFALTGCQTTDDGMDDTAPEPAPAEPASMDSTMPTDSTTPPPATEPTTPPPAGTPEG